MLKQLHCAELVFSALGVALPLQNVHFWTWSAIQVHWIKRHDAAKLTDIVELTDVLECGKCEKLKMIQATLHIHPFWCLMLFPRIHSITNFGALLIADCIAIVGV